MISSTRSADARASSLRAMPSCSTASSVLRIPAVSSSVIGTPSSTISLSRRSRVVPGRSVTIARSRRLNRFSRELLPTLGRPTRAAPNHAEVRPLPRIRHEGIQVAPDSLRSCSRAAPSRGGRSSSKSTPPPVHPTDRATAPQRVSAVEGHHRVPPWPVPRHVGFERRPGHSPLSAGEIKTTTELLAEFTRQRPTHLGLLQHPFKDLRTTITPPWHGSPPRLLR